MPLALAAAVVERAAAAADFMVEVVAVGQRRHTPHPRLAGAAAVGLRLDLSHLDQVWALDHHPEGLAGEIIRTLAAAATVQTLAAVVAPILVVAIGPE
jgi:hypothetical protein